MIKEVFHGSNNIINKPQFGYGNINNDYGLGFYCTEDIIMAKEWGVTETTDGFVNRYKIDTTDLSILNLNSSDYSILNWISILLENRIFDITNALASEAKEYLIKNFLPDYKNFDIITGFRADDSYFSFAQDFINGTISVRQLGNAMKLGNLGTQFVIKSKKAFDSIIFDGFEIASSSKWFPLKQYRDKSARRQYFDVEKNKRQKNDLYIIQILNEEVMPNDPRIR